MKLTAVWIALACAIVIEATNPRSVNLAIEASVLLEPEDVKQNNAVLTKIRRFLDQLGKAFAPIEEPVFRSHYDGTFTHFIAKICNTVLKYGDEDLSELQKALVDAAELTLDNVIDKNKDIVKFVTKNLKYLGTCKLKDFKNILDMYLKKGDDVLQLGRLDKFYNDTDVKKLETIVAKFENYSLTHDNLTLTVRDALKVAVFDNYKDLREPKMSQFDIEVDKLQKHISLMTSKHENESINNTASDMNLDDKIANELANEIVINKDIVINVGGGQNNDNDNSVQDKEASKSDTSREDSA